MRSDVSDGAQREELDKKARNFMGVSSSTERSAEDLLSTPQPGESLAVFYARTKTYWAQKAHETVGAGERGKELRKSGFELAEKRYGMSPTEAQSSPHVTDYVS